MSRAPDANAPPSSGGHAPSAASEENVVRSPTSHRDDDDPSSDEEQVRDVDPHPDTPDDFDEDASAPRESIEAVQHDKRDADDDD